MKKVAIVGSQELTRDNAPYDDPSYEIWSFADWLLAPWLKRCDAILEIHLANVYMNHPRTPGYWDALQKTEKPVYMYPVADPRVPNSVLYPKEGVLGLLSKGTNGGKKLQPLNCTVAYALGLAIFLGYEVIDVYGVELVRSSQFMPQQPHFAFWDGFALGRGIELNVNCSEGLFVQPLYGSEDTTQTAMIHTLMEGISGQRAEAIKAQHMTEGALQALQKLLAGGGNV